MCGFGEKLPLPRDFKGLEPKPRVSLTYGSHPYHHSTLSLRPFFQDQTDVAHRKDAARFLNLLGYDFDWDYAQKDITNRKLTLVDATLLKPAKGWFRQLSSYRLFSRYETETWPGNHRRTLLSSHFLPAKAWLEKGYSLYLAGGPGMRSYGGLHASLGAVGEMGFFLYDRSGLWLFHRVLYELFPSDELKKCASYEMVAAYSINKRFNSNLKLTWRDRDSYFDFRAAIGLDYYL